MSHRSEVLSEEQWDTIAPLLPELISPGRPWSSNRQLFEGILWFLRSGAGWPYLPDRYPSPLTCWPRWRRWEEDGTWLRVWRRLIDGEETFIKGSLQSEKPKSARVRSWWWWQRVRLFLSETTFVRPHRRQWPWSRPHWLDSSQRCRYSLWLLTNPMTVNPDVNDWPINTLSWWQRIEKIERRAQHKMLVPYEASENDGK